MAIDTQLIGSVINALPLDRMISGPLNAMVKAQVAASKAYADFLLSVCMDLDKDGNAKARELQFLYDETLVDTQGQYQGKLEKTMRIPLLAAITHPNLCIEEGSIDFELEVSQSEETKTSMSVDVGWEASIGWGPFSLKVHGKASAHREQTRKTDTRAKYSVHCTIKRQGPPEGLMRVIDFMCDNATKPVQIPTDKRAELPAKVNESAAKEKEAKEKDIQGP